MTLSQRILRKIVKNEAMAADPPEIYGWRVYLLACSACFGAMSFGWDSSVIGGVIVMPPFIDDYKLGVKNSPESAALAANIVSTLQAGCFLGALIASPLTDRFGRKWCLITISMVILAGVIMQAASSGNLGPMYAGRFIAGVGVGAASTINPIYVSENAPRAIRGLLTGLYQLFIVTGGMLAFWINYSASLHFSGKLQYVFPLAIQALPAMLLCGCMLLCQESPRWLARRDRWEETKAVLSRIRNLPPTHPYLEEEFKEIVDQLERERQLIGDATFWKLQKEMWCIPGNRNRALISIFLMICQQMTGTNAINTYAPTIFANLGITGVSNTLFSTGIYGIVKVLSCMAFLLFMADSLGRRRSLLWTSIAQGLAMFYIGLYVRIAPPKAGDVVPPAGYFALVSIFLFAAFFQFGWGPTCWIYASEIPTARLRSMNVSYAAATQWLFNFVVARAVPTMLVTAGGPTGYGTYLIFGSFCFSMFFFVWFFIPETKGMSLESMDALFGVTAAPEKSLHEDESRPEEITEAATGPSSSEHSQAGVAGPSEKEGARQQQIEVAG
ncbi:general substrate transporter [Podospora appendiculata]|uniref:General substrate transporter n=1 Tax=Podospora appendiculata TaxID=314037 RepID=A0AAE1CG59_9PEZI|nr:general substrate transporter [Podospora appendiculata]